MWFSTVDGLNRFDGYSFTTFRHDPLNPGSIPYNGPPIVYEDRSGTLWMRYFRGLLCRFDRSRENFTICMDGVSVSDMYEDSSGALWFATLGRGLNRYDRTHNRFARCGTGRDSLTSVWGDPAAPGILWVGSAHGIERYDQSTDRTVGYDPGPDLSVTILRGDKRGDLWIGTTKGLCRFDTARKAFSTFPFGGGEPKINEGRGIQNILEDSKGILWVASVSSLAAFDSIRGAFIEHPIGRSAGNRPPDVEISSICEMADGTICVATDGQGVGFFDRVAQKFRWYTNNPKDPLSLVDDEVHAVYEDRSGSIWVGTEGGLDRIDRVRKFFTHYIPDPLSSGSLSHKTVCGFAVDRSGVLWITTLGGLNRFNSGTGTFTHYGHDPGKPQSLCSDRLTAVLADSKGALWIGSLTRGLDRLDLANGMIRHYVHEPRNVNSLGNDLILSLLEDRSGNMWIGTGGGVLDKLDVESGKFVHFFQDRRDSTSLGGNWVSAIHQDRQGAIWVGTRGGGGLCRLDEASGKFMHIRSDPRSANGLSNNNVHSICEDSKGNLWIGTGAGLDMLERPSGRIRHFTTKDGISNDYIVGILEDDRGSLWVRTHLGVSKFDPATGKFRNYGVNDGVNIMTGWDQSYYKDRQGEMYFGGTNGFIRFHPDSLMENPYVPPVVITAFRMSDSLVTLGVPVPNDRAIALSYRENVFSIQFAALNYTHPEQNQYRYTLEGYDRNWIQAGTRHLASYSHVDPGTYLFRVSGSNNDGIWNESGTSLMIVIAPPYWQTWWFRLVMAVVIVGLISLAYNYRVAKLLEMERLRLRIARDLHDEMGSNLSGIALMSDVMRTRLNLQQKEDAQLVEIGRTARQMAEGLREIVWAINPAHDGVDDLVGRMKSISSTMLQGMSYSFQAPGESLKGPVDIDKRRNIILMYKEILHNVRKHSRATHVDVRVSEGGGFFTFTVIDNGVGFETNMLHDGNGLSSMKARAAQIGAAIDLDAAPGRGVRIAVTTKIP